MNRKSTTLYVTYLAIFFCLTIVAGCAKEGEDLTGNIVGQYLRGVGTNALIIKVDKVNNKTVAISFETTTTSSMHGSSTMNSATDFTLNAVSGIDNTKNERYEYTGTGTLSGTDLIISRHEKIFTNSTGTLLTEYDTTYVAKKR